MKKLLVGAATAALLTLGVGAVTTTPAAAHVYCNREGDCWHTDSRYSYGRDVHAEYHPDSWYWHRDWDHDHDRHWRGHHEGRGYWRNGVWITF